VKRSESDNIARAVVDLLGEIRRQKSVNFEDLGGLTGLHATSLSLIERHLRKPTFVNLCRIASALKVKLSTIVKNAENQVHGQNQEPR